jgi:hypothetical protein
MALFPLEDGPSTKASMKKMIDLVRGAYHRQGPYAVKIYEDVMQTSAGPRTHNRRVLEMLREVITAVMKEHSQRSRIRGH